MRNIIIQFYFKSMLPNYFNKPVLAIQNLIPVHFNFTLSSILYSSAFIGCWLIHCNFSTISFLLSSHQTIAFSITRSCICCPKLAIYYWGFSQPFCLAEIFLERISMMETSSLLEHMFCKLMFVGTLLQNRD